MALNANQIPIYANKPRTSRGTLSASSNTGTLGSDTNGSTIFTAEATTGSRIMSILASTDDTVTVNVYLYILNGSTVRPLGLVNIPLSSGNTFAARIPVDCLDSANLPGLQIDQNGKRYFDLGPGEVLKATALANLTAAKTCYLTAIGADYA